MLTNRRRRGAAVVLGIALATAVAVPAIAHQTSSAPAPTKVVATTYGKPSPKPTASKPPAKPTHKPKPPHHKPPHHKPPVYPPKPPKPPIVCHAGAIRYGDVLGIKGTPSLKGAKTYTILIDVKTKSGWKKVGVFSTQKNSQRAALDLPRGTYRVKCSYGSSSAYSGSVNLKR